MIGYLRKDKGDNWSKNSRNPVFEFQLLSKELFYKGLSQSVQTASFKQYIPSAKLSPHKFRFQETSTSLAFSLYALIKIIMIIIYINYILV
ncbi:hypothetical protein BWD08_02690 [Neisseria animaloris]|nr:hypothetical protein BWD08_02690 [Neisseria animaloris]